jgi:cytochrome P450
VFSAPDAIRTILTADPADAHAGKGNHVLEPLLGPRSLLLLDGTPHQRERRLLMPSFQAKRIDGYGDILRAATNDAIDALAPGGQVVAMHATTQAISLHVILRAVLGLGGHREHDEIASEIQAFLDDPRLSLATLSQLRDGVDGEGWRAFQRRLSRIDTLLFAEIERRRASPDASRQDVMSVLLGARYEDGSPLTDAALRDELVTLLVTGYETTAAALAWALHWIHQDRQVERRLRDELTTLGPDPAPAALAEEAPYLRAVCNETLRIHPILPVVARQLQRPLTVQGYALPAGIHMTACIYLAHRRAATFPEPQCFRPERFLAGEPSIYEFLPFGGGSRRCLGILLALFEMKVALGTLLSRCSFEAAGGAVRPVRRSVTIAPSDATRLRVLHVAPRPG